MDGTKAQWPDYGNCIANLPNSILKAMGTEAVGGSLPLLDGFLTREYRNYVVILLDGMGVNILEQNLGEGGFFRSHLAGEYSSVFPPTTVAATTSIRSGLEPCEHAWLGWDCYYPQIGKNVTVFRNTEQDTEIPAADYPVAWTYTPYESVAERLQKDGKAAYVVSPHDAPVAETIDEILLRVLELCEQPERKYIYAYWSEPDHTMHGNGCYSEAAKEVVRDLEKRVEELCGRLEDTLVIVTADHRHIDSRGVSITDYPAILECLERLPSIEPRALNFFVKEGKKGQFEAEFKRNFADTFLLLSKEEVLEKKLFGTAKEHPLFRQMLGDYLAVALGDLTIYNSHERAARFIGVHAGLCAEEMRIPLIVFEA